MLLPVKLFGLFLLGEGHAMSALLLLLVAKLVGTAILARLFQLVEPALMQLPWFARFYPRWKVWKDGVLERVRLSAPLAGGRPRKVWLAPLVACGAAHLLNSSIYLSG